MAYSLSTSYVGESLISGFKWHHGRDLSNGFVSYKSQQDALDLGLYSVDPLTNVVRLGVDSQNKYDLWEGRPSVRLESKQAYNHGLFIADFLHMPPSQCGVWPAFWAYGSPWPHGGEIDIIEGANMAYSNIISAHTSDGCFLDPATEGLFTGERRNLDCAIGTMNVGCGYNPPASDVSSYGDGFNAANGGVYAMEWDSDYIKVWHFPRGSIPSDIDAKKPEPQGWGLPQALFGGSACDVDSYFKNMNIVININFCGDYGAATWKDFATCASLADTCADYVADNPEAFKNAYWDVKYIDVYDFTETLQSDAETDSDEASTDDAIFTAFVTGSNSTLGVFPTGIMSQNTTDDSTSTTTKTATTTTTITVTPTFTPAPESNVPANPAQIGNYAYLGCFGSSTGFQTFNFTQESSQMTIERCIDACAGIRYAGLFEGNCYCANELDADTRAVANEASCDRPCPGKPSEFCGGFVSSSSVKSRRFMLRRDVPSTSLLTVYADLTENEPPAQPPAIGPAPSVAAPTTTVTYTRVITVDSQVQTQRYVKMLTLEDCGCAYPTYVAMPAATEVPACDVCQDDGEGVTTLTVPVVPVRATTTAPTLSTRVASAADAAGQSEAAPAQVTGSNQTHYFGPSNGSYVPDEPVIVTGGAWTWREARVSAVVGGVLMVLVVSLL